MILEKNTKPIVQVFIKAPVPGKVKTRLAAEIGDDLAAQFAQLQFNYLLNEIPNNVEIQCWIDGNMQHPAFDLCHAQGIACFQQLGTDLGDKMLHSMHQGLQQSDKVLVVGSDCSGLAHNDFVQALDALDRKSMVFVPAEDGGFVLWGSKVNQDAMFKSISWGSEAVWQQVQHLLLQRNIQFCRLDESWDIDTRADIKKHQHELPTLLLNFCVKNSINFE